MGGVEQVHPLYAAMLDDWNLMAHSYAGERVVKQQRDVYLPPTSAMVDDGFGQATGLGSQSTGEQRYCAYLIRAVYHDFVRLAVTGMLGVMHRKPPVVNVPAALQAVVDSMTVDGEPLELLWRRITAAQLLDGRMGLLVDVPSGAPAGQAVPYVVTYGATAVRNWDAGMATQSGGRRRLRVAVLDESGFEREMLEWTLRTRYRVLALADDLVEVPDVPPGAYVTAVVEQNGDPLAAEWLAPRIGDPLTEIPFVFVNPNDLVAEPDSPPLLGLANLAMAIYRGEADYRQALFAQGQDTLVMTVPADSNAKTSVGAGAVIEVPFGGDAKFIGVSATGLPEMRQALENDKRQASQMTVQTLDASGGEDQSGEALRVRVSARTATLKTMQLTAAGALRDCLVHAGHFLGMSDAALEAIEVTPNLDFSDATITGDMLARFMEAKARGLPLAMETIHDWLREHEFTELTFEEEMARIKAERATEPPQLAVPLQGEPQ